MISCVSFQVILIQNMAEARAVPSLGGYDDEFVNAVEEDLRCAICQLPLKEAVQTGKCGHRFCRQCLEEHFRRLAFLTDGKCTECRVVSTGHKHCYASAFSYVYVGPVFTGHKRCYASAYDYPHVASKKPGFND